MLLKNVVDEDICNYKKTSMFIAFPYCTFKCEKDCGIQCCQNSPLVKALNIEFPAESIVNRYINNSLTHAIVCGGLEPLDSFDDLITFIDLLRQKTDDDCIIYTGYFKSEILDKIEKLQNYKNIIMKYGRYVPGQESHYDELLGIKLANKEQYAEKIS